MIQSINNPTVVGHLVSRQPEAKPAEMGILVLWMSVIFIPDIPAATLLRYSCVLYYLSFLVLDAKRTWWAIRISWIMLPLAVWGMLSTFWSPYPGAAFRESLLFMCSVLVTIVIGCRYTPHQLLKCVLITGVLGTLYAALYLDTANLGGPYSSKNFLALHMSFAYIALIAVALDKRTPIVITAPLLAFAGLAGFIIVKSEAVSAILLMGGATLILLAIKLVFIGLAGLRGARTLLFVFASSALLLGMIIFFNFVDPRIVDDFLALFGKDSSLTGRTNLWAAAQQIISDRPIFGLGLEGFWQYDVGQAQTLVENDHREPGTKLGFHNAYLEIGAHLGLVGMAMLIAMIVWATFVITLSFLRNPSMISGGFFTLMIITLANSYTESFLAGSLNITVTVFFGAATLYSVWQEPRRVAALGVRTESSRNQQINVGG